MLANVVEDGGSHLYIGASERLLGDPRLCGDGGEQDEQEKQKEAGHCSTSLCRLLRFGPGVALGFHLVPGRIFIRLGIAGPSVLLIVQHRCGFAFSCSVATSATRPLVRATFQTSASIGWTLLSLASLENSS
jgi:hypothetical protein